MGFIYNDRMVSEICEIHFCLICSQRPTRSSSGFFFGRVAARAAPAKRMHGAPSLEIDISRDYRST